MRPPTTRAALSAATLVTALLTFSFLAPAAQAVDVDEAREQVKQLGAEVESAAAEYNEVEARLEAQRSRVEAAEARIASQTAAIEKLQLELATLAVETFKRGGVDPELSLLATGGLGLSSGGSTLTVLAERRSLSITDLQDAQDELERMRSDAQTDLDEVVTLEADLAARRADIEKKLDDAKGVLAVAEAEEQARIAAEEARRQSEASRSSRDSSAGTILPTGNGVLATPTPGRQSAYGWRTHPVYGDRRFHSGMDIITGCGTPVVAAADGVVQSARWDGSYGNIIVVQHAEPGGGALTTAYAHLSSFGRTSGSVSRGEVIGYVGTTGLSTGCHLHFEVRVNGDDQDPARYI